MVFHLVLKIKFTKFKKRLSSNDLFFFLALRMNLLGSLVSASGKSLNLSLNFLICKIGIMPQDTIMKPKPHK